MCTRHAIYFPFLRGRAGEIEAIGRCSPLARARMVPVLDLTKVDTNSPRLLEEHATSFARAVVEAWGAERPIYLDVTRYGPESSDSRGRHIVEHLFDNARQLKISAIPVSGPVAERGPGTRYIEAVARIAKRDDRGAALRVPYEDFSAPDSLAREIGAGLHLLDLPPEKVDLFLDGESFANLSPEDTTRRQLLATLLESLKVASAWPFRVVVFAGSSIPNPVPRGTDGEPLRIERIEFRTWKEVAQRGVRPLVRFGDTAVWSPKQLDSGGGGPPPARVRLPIGDEQVFFRGEADEYADLCRQALQYEGVTELPASWGVDQIRGCAAGYVPPREASRWVARDTNVHIEATVAAVQACLSQCGRLNEVAAATLETHYWRQPVFDDFFATQ